MICEEDPVVRAVGGVGAGPDRNRAGARRALRRHRERSAIHSSVTRSRAPCERADDRCRANENRPAGLRVPPACLGCRTASESMPSADHGLAVKCRALQLVGGE